MAGGKKISVSNAERIRRKTQSQRDKKPAPSNRVSAKRLAPVPRSLPAAKMTKETVDYVKLVLDPCEAKLAYSTLPGTQGSHLFRIPYRITMTVPSGNRSITGGTTQGAPCTTVFLGLFPHAAHFGPAPRLVYMQGALGSGTVPGNNGTSANSFSFDPIGLNSLNALAGQVRPIAACIKAHYTGLSGQAAGIMTGYEGPLMNCWDVTATTHPYDFFPNVSYDTLYTSGVSTSSSTSTMEVCINYAAAGPEWQKFKDLPREEGDIATDSVDIATMPIAMIAMQDVTPGQTYTVEGAVVYEWLPSFGDGLRTSERKIVPVGGLEKTQNALTRIGRMLVKSWNVASESNWMERAVSAGANLALKSAARAVPLLLM